VFVIGNEGSGKSTLCNKLVNLLQNEELLPPEKKDFKMYFEAGQSVSALATDIKHEAVKDVIVVDSPGHEGGCKEEDKWSWTKFIKSVRKHDDENINLEKSGLNCVIFTIMAPDSGRIESNVLKTLYDFLFLLTVTYPKVNKGDKNLPLIPEICVVINRISRETGITNFNKDSDVESDGDHVTFEEIRDQIY